MTKKSRTILDCCKVEAVISVDERGQMVLPKEIRERAQIKAGDKLAIVTGEQGGQIRLISLIKAEQLEETVKSILNALGQRAKK